MKVKLVKESLNEGMYNDELFQWLLRVLDKYGEKDSMEIIVEIFRKAMPYDLDKNQIFKKLEKYNISNPKLIDELFSRWDDLRFEASNI